MKISLKPFQETYVAELIRRVRNARRDVVEGETSCVIFSAPTGSGKTIMAGALLESLVQNIAGVYAPPAIIWLSDQPEINEQTRQRLLRACELVPGRLISVESNLESDTLDCGSIYFVNTQKLARDRLLVTRGDRRPNTFWDVVSNTIKKQGPGGLLLVIDEAHRGLKAKTASESSLVQSFFAGRDEMPPIPLIVAMSATPERLIQYLGNGSTRSRHFVSVPVPVVRESGLIKDRIALYNAAAGLSDYAILTESAKRWQQISSEWSSYCQRQGEEDLKPLLVVQVLDRAGPLLGPTATDLDTAISSIESIVGPLQERAFAHAFDQGGIVSTSGGRQIRFIDAADINGDRDIRVIFFKQSLATGWDCPRAEVMMSFRPAKDATFITQLVGRIVRTPFARRIEDQESLNQVDLFLPHYDSEEVTAIVKLLTEDFGIAVDERTVTEPVVLFKKPEFHEASKTIGKLSTFAVPARDGSPARKRAMRLATLLMGNGTLVDAPLRLTDEIRKIYEKYFDQVCNRNTVSGTSSLSLKLLSLGGEVLDDESIAVRLTDNNIDDIVRAVEGNVLRGTAIHVIRYLASEKKLTLREAKAAYITLSSSDNVIADIEVVSEQLYKGFCEVAVSKVSEWADRDNARFGEILQLNPTPSVSFLVLPDSIAGDDVPGFDDGRFLYAEQGTGLAKHDFNDWEEIAIDRLFEDLSTEAVFRNPALGLRSLAVPYRMDGRWKAFHPDFIAVKRGAVERSIVISEPHRSSLRDFLPKALGLADYVERAEVRDLISGAELITEYDGKMWVLPIHEPSVRQQLRNVAEFEEILSLMVPI